jgi:signal transduction histidine kinase
MNRLGDIRFAELLPGSIRDDQQLRHAAEALDGSLQRTTAAIPNLLIWSRLDRANALTLPPLARIIDAAGGLNLSLTKSCKKEPEIKFFRRFLKKKVNYFNVCTSKKLKCCARK